MLFCLRRSDEHIDGRLDRREGHESSQRTTIHSNQYYHRNCVLFDVLFDPHLIRHRGQKGAEKSTLFAPTPHFC